MPADVDILKSHDIIDNIEHDMWDEMHVRLNLHMDPVDTKNEQLALLKQRAQSALSALDDSVTLHDFRMVKGESHTNLVFDVVIPYDSKINLQNVHEAMEKEFENDETKYYFVIEIDRKMS